MLFLLLVANGAPVIGANLLGNRAAWPLDMALALPDGRRLLGPSKTWRGIALALIATPIMAWLIGLAPGTGVMIGLFAMLGDAASSFVKRRLGLAPSSMALGMDQIPESLLPLWTVKSRYGLDWPTVLVLTGAFLVLELLLSWILYQFNLRKQPY